MITLYKYRPLSDFLFKELLYQEVYFGSHDELNDPLGLTADIDFSPNNIQECRHLLNIITKVDSSGKESWSQTSFFNRYNFYHSPEKRQMIGAKIFQEIKELKIKEDNSIIKFESLKTILEKIARELDWNVDFSALSAIMEDRASKIFRGFYSFSLSENNDNYLMWSHYGGRHMGVCLEFEIDENNIDSFFTQKTDLTPVESASSKLSLPPFPNHLTKVLYANTSPIINFFEYYQSFIGMETDLEYINNYQNASTEQKLRPIFSTKTDGWNYEREWRIFVTSFGKRLFPEQRLFHYKPSMLKNVFSVLLHLKMLRLESNHYVIRFTQT